ncbi:hypothetical protein CBR_g16090 [Chara braunii]|uniref:DUF3825 domain-containing protein n=1 Tax=Chara braunii TaxID=69332 RepID=A0A388KTK0_CHABU|nr:hypothetical protein CBR_g16090 [Chara braunii]|eukprot:GBG73376.1 hypothetical protein CBR_g16090 [Chara braunii]
MALFASILPCSWCQVLEGECSPEQPTCIAPCFLSAVERGSVPEKAKKFMCRNRLSGDCHYAYEALAKLAENEEWTLKRSDGHPGEYLGCLRAYLNQQFLRLVEQGKVVQCFNEDGRAVWVCFCLGLLAESSEELIYVILQRNESDSMTTSSGPRTPWRLKEFVLLQQLQDAKQPWNALETILDPPEKIWDCFEEHIARFPSTLLDAGVTSQTRKQAVMGAIQRASRIVQNNPLAAVPQFVRPIPKAPGVIQMLLPLKLDADSNDAHLALVLETSKSRRGGRVYRATKLIPLDCAYINARVLMPLYQPWLTSARVVQKTDRPAALSLPMNHNLRPIAVKPVGVPTLVSAISGHQGSGISPGVSPRFSYQLNSGPLSPAPIIPSSCNNGAVQPAGNNGHRPSSPTAGSINSPKPMLSQIGSQPLVSITPRSLSGRSSSGLQSPKPTPLQLAATSQMASTLNGSGPLQSMGNPQAVFSQITGAATYADGGVNGITAVPGVAASPTYMQPVGHQQLTSALQSTHLSQSNLRRSLADMYVDNKPVRGTGVSLPLYAELGGGSSTPSSKGGLSFEDALTPRGGGNSRLEAGAMSPLDQMAEVLQLNGLSAQSPSPLGDPKTPTGASGGFSNPWSNSASPIDTASGLMEDIQSPLAYGSGGTSLMRDEYPSSRMGGPAGGSNASGMVSEPQARMGTLGLYQQQSGTSWPREFGAGVQIDLGDQRQDDDVYVGFTPQDDLCPKINISQLPPRFVAEFLSGDRHTGEADAERHVEQCFGRYGLVARSLVRENKNHPGKWFAIVEFAYWTDDNVRQRLVAGEQIRFCQFYAQ